ncbi:MAG: DivIVA domain-containing protein [Oscillospiraceae bacterium]|nr:DivIVA domain-containing protein [Oscillospiraceae bacterium]MDY2847548.1 DivIVA domain-containing protein [Oscillospiraceae bacterium]
MITAKEIDSRMFEQAKPGYKPEEVDEFLKEISDSFKELQAQLAEKDKKMAFLVETVKKYKQDEEDLKGALIYAQKQSREIIAEAQQKAEQIIAEANVKSDEIIGSTSVRRVREQEAFDTLRREVSDFRTNLLEMYRDHLSLINNIPGLDEEDEEETVEEEQTVETAEEPVIS